MSISFQVAAQAHAGTGRDAKKIIEGGFNRDRTSENRRRAQEKDLRTYGLEHIYGAQCNR